MIAPVRYAARLWPYERFGPQCHKGWAALYDPIIERCKADGVVIHQIKQSHGLMCIYVGAASPAIREEIASAERASAFICELCGEGGSFREIAEIKWTLCDACAAKKTQRPKP